MNPDESISSNLEKLIQGISKGHTRSLAQAITLVESHKNSDQEMADMLIEKLMDLNRESIRIGITGVPGVGKSTFIESFGEFVISQGRKVAVLSIDPTSSRSKGSILGDKTRMNKLAANENAFIRPSPSSESLGGVALATRDAIILCEAAGYDTIIIETVGVGQSETEVKNMVDYFQLLVLPGGGDELQGIKRGIMEMADGIFVNKADADPTRAKQAKKDIINAIHLFPPLTNNWTVSTEMGSALTNEGIDKVWKQITSFEQEMKSSGWFDENRLSQRLSYFKDLISRRILAQHNSSLNAQSLAKELEKEISSGNITVRRAVRNYFLKIH